jgi:hypothetical protein
MQKTSRLDRLTGKFSFSRFFEDELQNREKMFNLIILSTVFYQQKICQY